MFPGVQKILRVVIVVALLLPGGTMAAQENQDVLLSRLQELIADRDEGHFVTPIPGSRSGVIAIDPTSSLYFYLERGSIRGSAINDFYAAYDSGDMETAYTAFLGSAIMTMRATDYGWNGLGNPMTTEAGTEIDDVLFKDVGGAFSRAQEITDEDVETYVALLETVVAALEDAGGSF